jgi:3-hydroxy-9,10-secoandrosta-1,3,5(10)-triene-9,17-dione monooxygenase
MMLEKSQSVAGAPLLPGAFQTGSDIVERARALIPILRSRAAATNANRCPSDETKQDMKRAGIAQIFQPKRFGGAEARLRDGIDVLRAIGSGCGSTAWISAQNVLHNLMIAQWPEAGQEEIWGSMPDALVCGILIPSIGKVRKTDGGYVVSGRWPFVSGANLADWMMFTGDCEEADGTIDDRHFLIPREKIEIIDTWHTIGLKGSASNDVALNEVFVPAHMSVRMAQLKGHGRGPGSAINKASLYNLPAYALFGCYIGSAALGIAEAAIEHYIAGARNRTATMSGAALASYTTQQAKVAEAQAAVTTARTLIYSIIEDAQATADGGKITTAEDRARYRALAAYAGRLNAAAVNIVFEAGGGAVVYDRNPLSLCFSDFTVGNRHTTQNWDVNAAAYGRVILGLPIGVPALDD